MLTPRLPVALRPNCQLTLTGTATTFTRDAKGNPVPSASTLTVQASLTSDRQTKIIDRPGIDLRSTPMVGWIVSPNPLPAGYELKSTVPAVLDGRVGRFEFADVSTPFIKELARVAGRPVKGVFFEGS